MKLFLFDLLCALLLSICNLVYPLIAKYIIEELAGQKEKINFLEESNSSEKKCGKVEKPL